MNKPLSPQRWLIALMLGFCLWQGSGLAPAHAALASALTYDRFLRYVEEGRVTDVRLLDNNLVAEVTAVDPQTQHSTRYRVNLLPNTVPQLVDRLTEQGIEVAVVPTRDGSAFWAILGNLVIPVLLLGGVVLVPAPRWRRSRRSWTGDELRQVAGPLPDGSQNRRQV